MRTTATPTPKTIVGHTTLATGEDPAAHGMVANAWLDRTTGNLTYNLKASCDPLLTRGAGLEKARTSRAEIAS